MKVMKKFGAVFLTLAMCLSLACVAFAADGDTYSITIENSIGGTTYSVYKVFDATYSDGAVSYTIDSGDAWFETANAVDSPFTLTQVGSTSTYVVSLKENATDSTVATWFNSVEIPDEAETAANPAEGTGGSLTFDLDEAGYYLVVPASYSYESVAVTVDTAAPDVTVIDKNQGPGEGPGPGDPEDPTWPGGLTKDDTGDSVSIGDEITYSIRSFVPTYNGETKITSYEVIDTMGAGLTYEEGTITVEIYGTGLEEYEDITGECVIDYDEETGTLTIKWNIEHIEEDGYIYPSDAMVRITYTDLVNDVADDTDLTNDVDLVWYKANPDYNPDDPNSQPEIPDTPDDPDDIPHTSDTVYTYGFELNKMSGSGEPLDGAMFTLSDEEGKLVQFIMPDVVDEHQVYEVYDGESEYSGEVGPYINVIDGSVFIWGLGEGTYYLTETQAPEGYNMLTEDVEITISGNGASWTISYEGEEGEVTVTGTIGDTGVETMPTVAIVNNAGSELPSTGGIGTTIFYIIGGVLVAGAVVVLITRRRMSSAD